MCFRYNQLKLHLTFLQLCFLSLGVLYEQFIKKHNKNIPSNVFCIMHFEILIAGVTYSDPTEKLPCMGSLLYLVPSGHKTLKQHHCFSIISVISRRWKGDNAKLLCVLVKKYSASQGLRLFKNFIRNCVCAFCLNTQKLVTAACFSKSA